MTRTFDLGSRARLAPQDLARFPDDTLLHRVARVVSALDCLPRKELFEAWEVARRTRRRFRGGRVVDLAAGHGLLAHLMLLLDDRSPSALMVDPSAPRSAARVHAAMVAAWPRLEGRLTFVEARIAEVKVASDDLVVSAHACGALTDQVLDAALSVGARVAVLPCCHDAETCDPGALTGWMDLSLAIDATRVARLRAAGYTVHTQHISATVTAKNRLLLAAKAE